MKQQTKHTLSDKFIRFNCSAAKSFDDILFLVLVLRNFSTQKMFNEKIQKLYDPKQNCN